MQITKALVLFSLFYISCIQAAPARRRKGKSTADTPQPAIPPPPSPPVVHSHGDIVGARAKEYENSKVDSIHPGVVVGGPDSSNNYKVAMISKNLPGSPPRESIATYQPGTSMEGSVSHNAPKVVPGNKLKPWLEKGSGSGSRQPPLTAAKLAQLKQAISSCPTGEALSRRGCVPRKPIAKKGGAKVTGGSKVPAQRPTQRQKPLMKTGGTKKPSSAKPNAQSVKKGGTKSPAQKPIAKNAGAKKPVQRPAAKPKAQPLKEGGAKPLAQKPVSKNAGAKKPVQKPAAQPKLQPLKKGGTKPQAQKSVPKSVGAKKPVQKSLAKFPAQKGGAKPPTQKPVPKNAGAKKPVQKPPAKPAAQPVKNGGAKPPAQKSAAKPVSKPPAKPAH